MTYKVGHMIVRSREHVTDNHFKIIVKFNTTVLTVLERKRDGRWITNTWGTEFIKGNYKVIGHLNFKGLEKFRRLYEI